MCGCSHQSLTQSPSRPGTCHRDHLTPTPLLTEKAFYYFQLDSGRKHLFHFKAVSGEVVPRISFFWWVFAFLWVVVYWVVVQNPEETHKTVTHKTQKRGTTSPETALFRNMYLTLKILTCPNCNQNDSGGALATGGSVSVQSEVPF